jgi:hypothetical protein
MNSFPELFLFVRKFSSVVGSDPANPAQNFWNAKHLFLVTVVITWQVMIFNGVSYHWTDTLRVFQCLISCTLMLQVLKAHTELFY